MSSDVKKNGKGKVIKEAVVSDKVKDYSKEPFFIKKAESAKKVIQKYGIPKHFAAGKK